MLNYKYFCRLGANLSISNIYYDINRFNKILDVFEKSNFDCNESENYLIEEDSYFSSLLK